MDYKQEHIEFIENILRKSPGFKGNEDLLEEMLNETLKKSESFLESSADIASLEIYIKKIAGNVVVDIIKDAESLRAGKTRKTQQTEEFKEVIISYETDNEGKIIHKIVLPILENTKNEGLSEKKLQVIKDTVIELDSKNPIKNHKQIFELRYLKEMNHREIAKKLDMNDKEVADSLLEILSEIDCA